MNLLFLISSLDRGGAETHLLSLVSELSKQGHSITVISAGGELTEKLHILTIAHKTLPLHSKAPFSLLYCHFALKKILQSNSYDLIHAHARIPAFLIAPLAKKKSIPFVATVHAQFRVTPFLRRFSRWGDATIAVSEDLRQYLCENYALCSQRIEVIPNGIDTEYFQPSKTKKHAPTKRLVYLSRLDEDCSEVAFLLCRLAPILRLRIPDLEIVLGGGGTAFSELKRLSDQINQAYEKPLVLLTGHLSDPRELFYSADCVIGVSRVALEATACEIPVILAGNEGFLGLLRPENFPKAAATNFCCRGSKKVTSSLLLEAITEVFTIKKEERTALVQQLAKEIQRQYFIKVITKETLLFYERIQKEFDFSYDEALLFCGYYGYGNLGDHALLRAAIERARKEHPTRSLHAMTAHGTKDEPLFGIHCIKRWHLVSLLRSIRSAKLLVFGGGTLLQDRTSFRSLCYYTFLLRTAARHGVTTELWANGVSAPRSRISQLLIQKSLCRCHKIGLRDCVSLSIVKELFAKTTVPTLVLEEDLAQKTPPAKDSRIQFLLEYYHLIKEDGSLRPFAVIAPRGREAAGQIRIFSWWLGRLRSQKIDFLFVPLFPKEDEYLCHRLAKDFGGTVAQGLSEQDLVGLMRYAQTVASMRLHALIFASSAKAPFVGFGEDPKIETFCKEYGGRYWTEDL